MKPLTLELQGFSGINSGLGKDILVLDLTKIPAAAQLVAFTGANGKGKSTIMDNLQPYRVMPSRSTTLGPGGFSYWDNICAPTAKKDLVWEHGGKKYRSSLTFKVSGKSKKADCYLFDWNDVSEAWQPIMLNDGTLSDGKSETYDRCVEGILGSPETFFTSMFSAQNRKSISAYGASDIKALLASILDLGHLRELSAKSALVGKMLRFQLDGLQNELSQSRGADAGIESVNCEVGNLDQTIAEHIAAEQVAVDAVDGARKALSLLESKRDSVAKDAEDRVFLQSQIDRAKEAAESFTKKITQQSTADQLRLLEEKVKAGSDLNQIKTGLEKTNTEINRLSVLVGKKEAIQAACVNLPIQREKIDAIDQQIQDAQSKLVTLKPIVATLHADIAKQSQLGTSGKAKAEAINKLKETASLINQVPCNGTDLQHKCPLLANANAAEREIQPQEVLLLDMRSQYRTVTHRIEELNVKVAEINVIEEQVTAWSKQRKDLSSNLDELNKLSALSESLEDAINRLPELEITKKEYLEKQVVIADQVSQFDSSVATVQAIQQASVKDISVRLESELKVFTDRIEQLVKPITEDEINQARSLVNTAVAGVEASRAKVQSCRDQRVGLLSKIEAFKDIKRKVEETNIEAERLADEIAKWKLIEKGMGNDGLIALSIDDAGPEISMLCNELLHDCYGGRFAVRLDTQRETQSGNIRETFDVMVFDNHRGEDKSLTCMSGGERVWVNECLTRAIALYVDQSNGVKYQTLFTDEADGALDPDRKRQFMQMKRAVLKRGGYAREYFISQTPELWEMADHIVDVAAL